MTAHVRALHSTHTGHLYSSVYDNKKAQQEESKEDIIAGGNGNGNEAEDEDESQQTA